MAIALLPQNAISLPTWTTRSQFFIAQTRH
jgi:hypothetical protein